MPGHFCSHSIRGGIEEGTSKLVAVLVSESDQVKKWSAAHLRFEASAGTAMALNAITANQGVPEFARKPCGPSERPAPGNNPSADSTRAAIEIDEISDASAGAEFTLRINPHRRVIGRMNTVSNGILEQASKRSIDPAEVGGKPHDAVCSADQAGDCSADTDDSVSRKVKLPDQ